MLEQTLSDDPSDGWVDNLAQEEDFLRVAFSDEDHEWTIELQHGDTVERHQCDADARGGRSGGSGLVHVQRSFVHNLQCNAEKVR